MTKTYLSADELAGAFPGGLRLDALAVFAKCHAIRELGGRFSVQVDGDRVTIPYRLHFDVSEVQARTSNQREIVDCILTRHSNGYLRQQHLTRIVGLHRAWVPPFVVQLAGEYVVEILKVIHGSLSSMDTALYAGFLRSNPAFLNLTAQRIFSYWDCYYRNTHRNEYVGFKILEYFRSLR